MTRGSVNQYVVSIASRNSIPIWALVVELFVDRSWSRRQEFWENEQSAVRLAEPGLAAWHRTPQLIT